MKLPMKILPLALLALGQNAYAQAPPGAGSQLNQLPPPVQATRAPPAVRIEQSTTVATPGADAAAWC
jgi:hypothetical protein